MDKDTALRLALEALEYTGLKWPQVEEAITAVEAALEAKDEPVAWKWHQAPVKTQWGDEMVVADLAIDKDHTVSIYCERNQTANVEAMFALQQQKQGNFTHLEKHPQFYTWTWDEWVSGGKWRAEYGWKKPERKVTNLQALYTTPPQRKPLTDEEIGDEFVRFQVGGMFTPFLYAVRAIEAAHGIKGEA